VLAGLAADLYWRDLERSDVLSRQAVEMARALDARDTLEVVLDQRYDHLLVPERAAERGEATALRLSLALESGDLESEFYARKHRLEGFVTAGEPEAIDREIETIAALSARMRRPLFESDVAMMRTARALWRAEVASAESLLQPPGARGMLSFAAQLFVLRRMQGRFEEVGDAMLAGARGREGVQAFGCAHALYLAQTGQRAAARELFEDFRRDAFAGLRRDVGYAVNLANLTEVCGVVGDPEDCEVLYELLGRHGNRNMTLTVILNAGSAARYRGLLAAKLGRDADAAAHFEDALDFERRMGARLWEAYAERDYAALCERTGDRAAAALHASRRDDLTRSLGIRL
jgi:hypothetical protein